MKGYKIFNEDMKCREFQYEVGKTYKHDGKIELSKSGFHFCRNPLNLFKFYSFYDSNRVCEIKAKGKIVHGDTKSVCSEITILRELSREEIFGLVNIGDNNEGVANVGGGNKGSYNIGIANEGQSNIGDANSSSGNIGDNNSGQSNIGDNNSGRSNIGSGNQGNYNIGDNNLGWSNVGSGNQGACNIGANNKGSFCVGSGNLGSRNVGYFNKGDGWVGMLNPEGEHPVYMFGKPCNWIFNRLVYSKAVGILMCLFDVIPEDRQKFWDELRENRKKTILELPNFDAKIFYEITGVKIKEEE